MVFGENIVFGKKMIFGENMVLGENTVHNAFLCDSSRAPLGWLFAQDAWPLGYGLRQSTGLKLIPPCPAGRVNGLGTSGLAAPD